MLIIDAPKKKRADYACIEIRTCIPGLQMAMSLQIEAKLYAKVFFFFFFW